MHNVVQWSNILCGVHTARFLKYVWPVNNILHERVKSKQGVKSLQLDLKITFSLQYGKYLSVACLRPVLKSSKILP